MQSRTPREGRAEPWSPFRPLPKAMVWPLAGCAKPSRGSPEPRHPQARSRQVTKMLCARSGGGFVGDLFFVGVFFLTAPHCFNAAAVGSLALSKHFCMFPISPSASSPTSCVCPPQTSLKRVEISRGKTSSHDASQGTALTEGWHLTALAPKASRGGEPFGAAAFTGTHSSSHSRALGRGWLLGSPQALLCREHDFVSLQKGPCGSQWWLHSQPMLTASPGRAGMSFPRRVAGKWQGPAFCPCLAG